MPGVALNPTVGPQGSAGDTVEVGLRAGRTKELIVGDAAKGKSYELVSRGNVWSLSTPQGGITCTALMAVSSASANGIVALWNPPNSAVNGTILQAVLIVVTGTMVTGGFVWGSIPVSATAPPAGVTTYRNNLTGNAGGAVLKAFDGSTALVGSAAVNIHRQFGGGIAGATGAGALYTFEEITDGQL